MKLRSNRQGARYRRAIPIKHKKSNTYDISIPVVAGTFVAAMVAYGLYIKNKDSKTGGTGKTGGTSRAGGTGKAGITDNTDLSNRLNMLHRLNPKPTPTPILAPIPIKPRDPLKEPKYMPQKLTTSDNSVTQIKSEKPKIIPLVEADYGYANCFIQMISYEPLMLNTLNSKLYNIPETNVEKRNALSLLLNSDYGDQTGTLRNILFCGDKNITTCNTNFVDNGEEQAYKFAKLLESIDLDSLFKFDFIGNATYAERDSSSDMEYNYGIKNTRRFKMYVLRSDFTNYKNVILARISEYNVTNLPDFPSDELPILPKMLLVNNQFESSELDDVFDLLINETSNNYNLISYAVYGNYKGCDPTQPSREMYWGTCVRDDQNKWLTIINGSVTNIVGTDVKYLFGLYKAE